MEQVENFEENSWEYPAGTAEKEPKAPVTAREPDVVYIHRPAPIRLAAESWATYSDSEKGSRGK